MKSTWDIVEKWNGIRSLKCVQNMCATESKLLTMLSQEKCTHFLSLSAIKTHINKMYFKHYELSLDDRNGLYE